MAHTDAEIKDLKINFGTKAKIEENIDSMALGELVFTTDNTLPEPPSANGEYNLKKDSNGLSWVEDSGGGGGTTDHSALSNLDYEHSGHTGFQAEISDLSTIRTNAQAGKTASDNLGGHTVAKNVPADAVFTDTVYDDTALKARVSTIENKESGWDAKQDAMTAITNAEIDALFV